MHFDTYLFSDKLSIKEIFDDLQIGFFVMKMSLLFYLFVYFLLKRLVIDKKKI